jgi:hypothetical protein
MAAAVGVWKVGHATNRRSRVAQVIGWALSQTLPSDRLLPSIFMTETFVDLTCWGDPD